MYVRIQLLCNWTDDLKKFWTKMTKKWDTFDRFLLVDENPDYYIVVNGTNRPVPREKTILISMEPGLEDHLDATGYLYTMFHRNTMNNMEWHLSLGYFDLMYYSPTKCKCLSAILSNKYSDPGHKFRIDLAKKLKIDVFGSNVGYSHYQRELPYHEKDAGLFPYKYTLAIENHYIHNYITEKLFDGIFAECLVFYKGAPNVEKWIHNSCYVLLPDDIEESIKVIQRTIDNSEWDRRIQDIRREKRRIMMEYNLFERLDKILL